MHKMACKNRRTSSSAIRLFVTVMTIIVIAASIPSVVALPSIGSSPLRLGSAQVRDYDRAATLRGGILDTEGAGSARDPNILELASVQELAAMEEDLSILNDLLQEVGATFYLEQSRDLTMFMPTNSAFESALVDVRKLPWEKKWRILQYHIIPNILVKLEDMDAGTKSYSTWEGQDVAVTVPTRSATRRNPEYLVNGNIHVVGDPPSIENFNGVSYKISQVLIPPDMNVEDLREQVAVAEATAEAIEDGDNRGVSAVSEEASEKEETPQFMQAINRAHSHWNQTLQQRASRLRQEYDAAATEAGVDPRGDGSRDPANSQLGDRSIGFLTPSMVQDADGDGIDDDSDASEAAKEAIASRLHADDKIAEHVQTRTAAHAAINPETENSDGETDETAGILSSGEIHSLALLDGSGFSFSAPSGAPGHYGWAPTEQGLDVDSSAESTGFYYDAANTGQMDSTINVEAGLYDGVSGEAAQVEMAEFLTSSHNVISDPSYSLVFPGSTASSYTSDDGSMMTYEEEPWVTSSAGGGVIPMEEESSGIMSSSPSLYDLGFDEQVAPIHTLGHTPGLLPPTEIYDIVSSPSKASPLEELANRIGGVFNRRSFRRD